jgi:hypothetical protein
MFDSCRRLRRGDQSEQVVPIEKDSMTIGPLTVCPAPLIPWFIWLSRRTRGCRGGRCEESGVSPWL